LHLCHNQKLYLENIYRFYATGTKEYLGGRCYSYKKETSSVIKYRTKFGVKAYKLDQRGICENSPKKMHN
jgi:hypothetical protein